MKRGEYVAVVIDGKRVADEILSEVAAETGGLAVKPKLAVVLAGDDAASRVYVNSKHKTCANLGIESAAYELKAQTTQSEILALIGRLCADKTITGILVQHPLPPHMDEAEVFAAIDPEKDVDGFNPVNVGKLALGENDALVPCTPLGVMAVLAKYNVDIAGKRAVVIGRSNIVGKPMARLLLGADATVTICHSKTAAVADITREADILVAAVGRRGFVTADMVKPGAAVIDVGIHRDGKKLSGDVAFDEVCGRAGYITPVPGGVGPMTIAMLMKNCIKAYRLQNG